VPLRLRLLAFLLVVWEPVSLSLAIAPILPTLAERGLLVGLALAVRVAVAGVAVAAGLALWNRTPHGIGLAIVALALSGVTQLAALLTPILPTNLAPDLRPVAVVVIVLYYGAWIAVLVRRRGA
jgi:hypothetical protein